MGAQRGALGVSGKRDSNRGTDKLSELRVRTAKPKELPYKLADGRGLYLHVQPGGGRYWRLKYRRGGKEGLYAIGVYPEITLAQARA